MKLIGLSGRTHGFQESNSENAREREREKKMSRKRGGERDYI